MGGILGKAGRQGQWIRAPGEHVRCQWVTMNAVSERQRVERAIRDDLDRVVPDVVATIREQIPAYRTLSAAQVEEVSAIAAWATSRILQLWVEGGELEPADVQRFRGIGAARALDGRPLPVILRAYRVAGTRITDLVADVGGDRLTVEDALALARLWMASIDTLSEALYAGHSAASERLSGDRERALADLLDDLLTGRQATRTALQDRCRELGVTLPATPCVLVTTGPAPADAVLARERDGTTVAVLADPRRTLSVRLSVRRSAPSPHDAGAAWWWPRTPGTCRARTGWRSWRRRPRPGARSRTATSSTRPTPRWWPCSRRTGTPTPPASLRSRSEAWRPSRTCWRGSTPSSRPARRPRPASCSAYTPRRCGTASGGWSCSPGGTRAARGTGSCSRSPAR